MSLQFEIVAQADSARRGRLLLPHGVVDTPAFMPVGSLGAVKGLSPAQLAEVGASIMLANLYHLALRPGVDLIDSLGGLHRFTGWQGPILTDSGGYQVFSLASLRTVDDEGVTFRSHLDGKLMRLTPESVLEYQQRLGIDIGMVLDECPPFPVAPEVAAAALERTNAWARRSRQAAAAGSMALFGILQGSVYPHLRVRAAEELSALDFDGYAIGGVSVGEPVEDRRAVVELTTPLLPQTKPRYLMGIGMPFDMLHAVRNGIDLFDCVLPSRNARHGMLFTRQGLLRIKNARYRADPSPPDVDCSCITCAGVSRAFLHHLMRHEQLTGAVLSTHHNIRFYLDFAAQLREAISSGSLSELEAQYGPYYSDGTVSAESAPTGDSAGLNP